MTTQITSAQDVLDDGFVLVCDYQRTLEGVVGEGTPYEAAAGGRYDVDLAAGTLTFSGAGVPPVVLRAHLLGSAAPGPGTWLWAWGNDAGFPDEVLAYARHVSDFGTRYGLTELSQAQQELRSSPREDARHYAALAATVCGGMTTYTCVVGAGTVVALLLDGPEVTLPAPSAVRAATLLPEVAAAGVVVDWRRAVESYGRMRGFGVEEGAGETTLRAADGAVVVAFDDLGRLSKVSGRLGG
jgi:hypothetical protein